MVAGVAGTSVAGASVAETWVAEAAETWVAVEIWPAAAAGCSVLGFQAQQTL